MSRFETEKGAWTEIVVDGATVKVTWQHRTDAAARCCTYVTVSPDGALALADVIAENLPEEYRPT